MSKLPYVIKFEGICKYYGIGASLLKAVEDVNLTIQHGEFISVMGPSGSGKTTLLNMMGCLDRPTKGECYFDSLSISSLTNNQLADMRNSKIGFVFQQFHLFPRLNALKNVQIPLFFSSKSASERHELALRALERVGLAKRASHRPSELSGGECQRVAIARSIINKPIILMADEPTGNLDSETSREIMELFRELNCQGQTIVIVTHDPEVSRQTLRTIVMRDGMIIKDCKRQFVKLDETKGEKSVLMERVEV